jgi:poly-gamma-glutamate capsule biosynthesis protein CapA/YwtB (metallophosphatase superfamily)
MLRGLFVALLGASAVHADPPRPIVLVAGGDVTLGYHYEEYVDGEVAKGKPRDAMIGWGFEKVKAALNGGDLSVVNLECPFTARGEKIPKNFNFRASPQLVAALLSANVGAVSLANNHLMDYGPEGLFDTLDALDAAKIPHFGAGRTLAEARAPAILERGGVKIAFLGYFFLGDHNIEPLEVIATAQKPGVAGDHQDASAMEKMVREDIAAAKARADLVIPFFHWGREGKHVPEPYQVSLAHAAVEAGAAAVLGSHPHVLQGFELYRGVPIAYSLGNFVFGGNWDPQPKESALWKARFTSAGYRSSEVIPLQTDRYPEVPVQPFVLEGEAAKQILQHLAEYSAGFKQTLPELKRR